MRIIYTLSILLSLCFALSAQSLVINPNEITTPINLEEFENIGYAKIKNTTSSTITVVWRREIISANNEWEISICDKNNCYLPFIVSRELVLAPGEESNLDVHVRHNNQKDEGVIKMIAYDKNNPADSVTAMYIFTLSTSSTRKVAFGENLKIWPNPASTFFNINDAKSLGRIEVLNLLGNVVKVFDPKSTSQFDIADLTSGIYFVRLISKQDPTKSKTIRLRKA
jgi:hypothetical protein